MLRGGDEVPTRGRVISPHLDTKGRRRHRQVVPSIEGRGEGWGVSISTAHLWLAPYLPEQGLIRGMAAYRCG